MPFFIPAQDGSVMSIFCIAKPLATALSQKLRFYVGCYHDVIILYVVIVTTPIALREKRRFFLYLLNHGIEM